MTKKHGLGLDSDYMARMDMPKAEPPGTVSSQDTVEVSAEQLESVRAPAREAGPEFEWAEPVVIEGKPVSFNLQTLGDAVNAEVLGIIDRLTRSGLAGHEIASAIQCLRNASKWLARRA